ncbi:MAG: serine/threonine protein kinase [Gemmataceae bacterium]
MFKNLFGNEGGAAPLDVKKRFEMFGKNTQGSMSKVSPVRERATGKMYCLKLLDKEKTARFEERFTGLKKPAEGAISVALHHRNLVESFEHGLTTEGEAFLLMELIDGYGLNFLIENHADKLDTRRVNVLLQMSDGLAYIHAQGYVHRDVCPRNMMVTKKGILKHIDFGLSIPFKPEFCRPGNRTGTADYLAPEVVKRQTTDQRVDLFALGVSAFELLTGGLPWEKASSGQHLMKTQPGKNPREFKPDLDDLTVEFLNKAIEREPARRFQTAQDFHAAASRLPRTL